MKKGILFLLLLWANSAAYASPIILNTVVLEEIIDCEIDQQKCQKIEFLKITTRTFYRESLPEIFSQEYRERVPYVALPNPCLDDTISLSEKPWCIPPHFEPTLGGAGPQMWGNTREWFEDSVLFRQRISDIDCPQIPTPEPSTLLYGACGLVCIVAGRKLRERRKNHGE